MAQPIGSINLVLLGDAQNLIHCDLRTKPKVQTVHDCFFTDHRFPLRQILSRWTIFSGGGSGGVFTNKQNIPTFRCMLDLLRKCAISLTPALANMKRIKIKIMIESELMGNNSIPYEIGNILSESNQFRSLVLF
ncbi:hypothetical protein DBV39_09910 [Orrella marina]|uniref:Uncharacterized protein n=1 Tax=Orrella marina TaxID=2163011 RepID=A0A2R4XJM9_9BURK|nr:hypothetical protein DBV39_09910 [Orrella marina]